MNATKCKGVKWNAANGENVETNPVCWDTSYKGWQEEGVNPWVVGTPRRYNSEAYDCRMKCAGKSGGSIGYCASEGWWNLEAAQTTYCSVTELASKSDIEAITLRQVAGTGLGFRFKIGAQDYRDACN